MAGASSSSSVEIRPAPRSMPTRAGSTPPSIQAGVNASQLRRRDGKLDVPGHVLPALAQRLDKPRLGQAGVSGSRNDESRRRHRSDRPATGNASIGRTAPCPPTRDSQKRSGESPSGVTRPRPVMTTRRWEPTMNDSTISARSGHWAPSEHSGLATDCPTIIAPSEASGGTKLTWPANFSLNSRTPADA